MLGVWITGGTTPRTIAITQPSHAPPPRNGASTRKPAETQVAYSAWLAVLKTGPGKVGCGRHQPSVPRASGSIRGCHSVRLRIADHLRSREPFERHG